MLSTVPLSPAQVAFESGGTLFLQAWTSAAGQKMSIPKKGIHWGKGEEKAAFI